MATESIIAIASTIINVLVMAAVWKLYNEYKAYNKETSWKNVKEHYDEVKIPKMLDEIERNVNEQIEKELQEVKPELDKLETELSESISFAAYVLMLYFPKERGQQLVREKMPSCEQYFKKIWVWHDLHSNGTPKTR